MCNGNNNIAYRQTTMQWPSPVISQPVISLSPMKEKHHFSSKIISMLNHVEWFKELTK